MNLLLVSSSNRRPCLLCCFIACGTFFGRDVTLIKHLFIVLFLLYRKRLSNIVSFVLQCFYRYGLRATLFLRLPYILHMAFSLSTLLLGARFVDSQ